MQSSALNNASSTPLKTRHSPRKLQTQHTISHSVGVDGVALHSGGSVSLRFLPAHADTGFVFIRTDMNNASIQAKPDSVFETFLGTCIADDNGATVKTVEHVLAAFVFAGIDNAQIEIDGPEPPILDGSARDLLNLITKTGRKALGAPKRQLSFKETVSIEDGDRFIRLEPADARTLSVTIDFPDAVIGTQAVKINLDDTNTVRSRLAPARTFCQRSSIDTMRRSGLALGGSLDNAIVVDGNKILNEDGLRDPKEFALHKALDLVGDLALIGAELRGRLVAHKPGHDINTAFAAKLVEKAANLNGK